MTTPRILRMITRLNVGGPARQALLLTHALREEFPTILAAGSPTPDEGELHDARVTVQPLPLVRPPRPHRDVNAVLRARRMIVDGDIALVHTHMAKAGTVGRIAAALVRPRPVTVHTFHGHVLDGYFSPPVQRAFITAERALARRTDVIVAVSSEIRDELLALGIGNKRQYRVIPVGLDLDPFLSVEGHRGDLRKALGIPEGAAVVGALGRLVAVKHHEMLLAVAARLPHLHVVIVGDGERRSALEAAARAAKLGERFHVAGWWSDVATALSDIDVVVSTSDNEGTPVALIEALAAARPVVATDVGGTRSVVAPDAGFLVPRGDAAAVAAHLEKLVSDQQLRSTMGAAGRSFVRSRFGADRLVADIRSLYRELLGEAGATPTRRSRRERSIG